MEEAKVAAAERADVLAAEQAAADSAAADIAELAAATARATASAVAAVAGGAECLRCDALPESLRPALPAAYSAAIDALLAHTAFTAAHVAEADFGPLPAAEAAEGEEAAAAGEGCTALRYVASSQSFVVGKTLEYGNGVSLAAAHGGGTAVSVPNVLLEPAIKFLKRPRFGAYACVAVTNPMDGSVIAVIGADTLQDGAEMTATDVATLAALSQALSKVHAAGVAAMQESLLAKLTASPPVVGSYAEPDPVPEPVEPTEEETAASQAKKDEFVAVKRADAEAPVQEGANPAPEFDEAAAVAEYEAMLVAELEAAILAEKTAASEAAAAAKTVLDEDLLRLDAYDKTQLAVYADYEDSEDAGVSVHALKATFYLQSALPSTVRQWLPLLAQASDGGFKDSVLAFDAAAVLPRQARNRAERMLAIACAPIVVEIPAIEANEEEGIEAVEESTETTPPPVVAEPLATQLLASLAVAALEMHKARRALAPLEDEDGADDEEPVEPEEDDTPWLYVQQQVAAPEPPAEGEEPLEVPAPPTCKVLYIATDTLTDVLGKVGGAKKVPLAVEGMQLQAKDAAGELDTVLADDAAEEGADPVEPKTMEGFGVEAGATLALAPIPEPEPEPEDGGAE